MSSVCFRLQPPKWTGRRLLLLEAREKRALIGWMRLKFEALVCMTLDL